MDGLRFGDKPIQRNVVGDFLSLEAVVGRGIDLEDLDDECRHIFDVDIEFDLLLDVSNVARI